MTHEAMARTPFSAPQRGDDARPATRYAETDSGRSSICTLDPPSVRPMPTVEPAPAHLPSIGERIVLLDPSPTPSSAVVCGGAVNTANADLSSPTHGPSLPCKELTVTTTYDFDASISSAVSARDGHQASGETETLLERSAHAGAAGPDAAVLGRGELPDGRADLPARQPAPARAAPTGAHQAAAARPLGHVAGPEPDLRPSEPTDQRARRERHLPDRPGPRRAGAWSPTRISRARIRRFIREVSRGPGGSAQPVSALLDAGRHPEPRQRADARLDPRGRRARLRAVARVRRRVRQSGSDRRARSSATARRSPGRSRARGRAPAFSIPPATARSCRSCT